MEIGTLQFLILIIHRWLPCSVASRSRHDSGRTRESVVFANYFPNCFGSSYMAWR
jgi:hypothetical protein